jgi:hypothetical protein
MPLSDRARANVERQTAKLNQTPEQAKAGVAVKDHRPAAVGASNDVHTIRADAISGERARILSILALPELAIAGNSRSSSRSAEACQWKRAQSSSRILRKECQQN